MIWFTVIFIYVLIGILSYYKVFSKWKDNTKFEQIWFSTVWITTIPLYLIHYYHNKEIGRASCRERV